jgi:hypothetical protein
MSRSKPLASVDAYKRALLGLPRAGPGSARRELLRKHYFAPRRDLTADQMAELMGYKSGDGANLQYGLLAADLARDLGLRSTEKVHIRVIATFSWPDGYCHWRMRPELALALEQLGWL